MLAHPGVGLCPLFAPAGRPAQAAAGPHIVPDRRRNRRTRGQGRPVLAAIAVTLDARPREVPRRFPTGSAECWR
jgi:hypothetical protein